MDSIEIATSASKQENFEEVKFVSKKKVQEFIETIERELDFDIMPLIEKLISRKAKSFSLSRENPNIYLFISNGGSNISINMRALGKQTKVLIPKATFNV